MKKALVIIICLGTFLIGYAQEEDLSVNNYWSYNSNITNTLYDQICSQAFTMIKNRWSFADELKTKNDWENRQVEVKKIMREIIGEFPAKTPLRPVITGTIKKDGFVVEKLYFESRPGFYVTCALFLPTAKNGKLPAIIYCCGHSREGFRSVGYQRSILNLVKKGFIVLAFDPVGQGERIQYFDLTGKSIFGATHEHSYPGTQSFISGLSPANYFIWDGIRAVDYLLSRKEVDPERIGITGRSGGGTQTAYIAAMDDRIWASAPECYITSFDKLLRSKGPQDAEQVLMYSLEKGFDMSDLIEVRTPKPTLMVTTTRDIFSIQGARDVFKEAQKSYAAAGASENINIVEDDAGHASTKKNRESLHAFFQKHLNNPGNSQDLEVGLFTVEELWVTPEGQVQKLFPSSKTLFSLNEKYTSDILSSLQSQRTNYSGFVKSVRGKSIELTGYRKPVSTNDYIFSGRSWFESYAVEKYLIKGPDNYYIPLLRLVPKQVKETILLVDDRGKNYSVSEGLAGQLASRGYEVFVPDLSGVGEMCGSYKGGDALIQGVPLNIWYAGVLTHRTPVAIRVEEIGNILDFIWSTDGFSGKITGISYGTFGSDLLHSAVIENRFEKIALIKPLYSFLSVVREKHYHTKFVMSAVPGIISAYDIPDLVAAIAGRKVLMVKPVDALDEKVETTIFDKEYSAVKEYFTKAGHPGLFTVEMNNTDIISVLADWLK